MKSFRQHLTEIQLNTALRAYKKMDDSANDWGASQEDAKRANRFHNRIKRKFGEKGAALADKIVSPETKKVRDERDTNRPGYDSLDHRVKYPLVKRTLKGGPRKGKLTKPTQDLLKLQSVYQRKNINKVKPILPEAYTNETPSHKVLHKGIHIGSLYQLTDKVVGYHNDSGAQFNAKTIEQGTKKMKRAHKSWLAYEKSNLKEAVFIATVKHPDGKVQRLPIRAKMKRPDHIHIRDIGSKVSKVFPNAEVTVSKHIKESTLNEVSIALLGRYHHKAGPVVARFKYATGGRHMDQKLVNKRAKGIALANKKLAGTAKVPVKK